MKQEAHLPAEMDIAQTEETAVSRRNFLKYGLGVGTRICIGKPKPSIHSCGMTES